MTSVHTSSASDRVAKLEKALRDMCALARSLDDNRHVVALLREAAHG